MHVHSLLSGFFAAERPMKRCSCVHSEEPDIFEGTQAIDPDTVRHERELLSYPRKRPRAEEAGGDHDFRNEVHFADEKDCDCEAGCSRCRLDAVKHGLCPVCDHPDVMEGEICLGLNVRREDFKKMTRLVTKRMGRAFSDDGRLLSNEWCSVIIMKTELHRIVLAAGLPLAMFT